MARLGAAKERRDDEIKRVIGEMEKGNYEIKRVIGEMEKGNYEIVDLENDEY
jgi:hypothetical protein